MHRKARQSYTKEFKEQAVSLVLEQDYKIIDAAERLGISKSALGKWVKAKKDEQTGSGLSFSEREELNQLRKMLKEAQMERDILKKAAAFFAKEQL
jgi:transposase